MVKLRVLEILKEQGKTKYWLFMQLGMSYQNFNKMVTNQTKSIQYKNIDAICGLLDCLPNDLFEFCPDEDEDEIPPNPKNQQ